MNIEGEHPRGRRPPGRGGRGGGYAGGKDRHDEMNRVGNRHEVSK